MDVRVNRELMLPALGRVVAAVERRQALPILGNLLVRAEGSGLTMVGTDMEMEVRAGCACEVFEEGESTIPARKLSDICRSLAEGADIRLKVSAERCVLTSGRGRYVLGTLPAADFPTFESVEATLEFEVEEGVLRRIFEKTAFAMAQQDVRYYLNGLLLEIGTRGLKAVGTDGHRLACFEHEWSLDAVEGRAVIIPFKTVTELRRQLSSSGSTVRVEVGERLIRFTMGEAVASSKLVDGRYPEYGRVIPAALGKVATVDREALRRALGRTAILSNEKFRGLRVSFETGVLRLAAQNPEQEEAVEEIELAYEGETTAIGFNIAYLAELLAAVDSREVEVRFEDGNSSSLWRGVGAEAETYVVMPMRL